ncbi:Gfo/Idh/MocA family protein [Pelagibacterium luteolum]|uniref:Predicted dehydrogenase n=1 Tax=Pelagibacterium luteolum TaxID=440168 RepID=A0A1G8A5A3_9HYPH|nr:Gfo/Idh/MocA family oxidoreductase [Pelagibacterium luteolum]SDH16051.1 Predicted dehydrogenase [Pelagibacterium luteolum]
MTNLEKARTSALQQPSHLPRIGFAGVGWIGRHRMQVLVDNGLCNVAAIAEPDDEAAQLAQDLAPDAERSMSFQALMDRDDLDAVVIATPSAAHAEQSIAALNKGLAVFCQKPLGRNAREVEAVVTAAKRADRLLGVDLSYRHTTAMIEVRKMLKSGAAGDVFAVDLVFHNAYGPDKPWFYDKSLSGGGCVIDLGVHLVDLALWALDFPSVTAVESELFAQGARLTDITRIEDFALATIHFGSSGIMRLACSWNLHAGREAEIAARFYGTEGGLAFENVGGSFYDFSATRFSGTTTSALVAPPDDWGGRAVLQWGRELCSSLSYNSEASQCVHVAKVLDAIYASDPTGDIASR